MEMKSSYILLFTLTFMSGVLQQDKYGVINDIEDPKIIENIHAVVCEGDTAAYVRLMHQIPYYDYFVYSIYMASKYGYALPIVIHIGYIING